MADAHDTRIPSPTNPAADTPDAHERWGAALLGLRTAIDTTPGGFTDEEMESVGRVRDRLENLLLATPATTLGGIRAQLAVADELLSDSDDEPTMRDSKAVRAALGSLDWMLARREEADRG